MASGMVPIRIIRNEDVSSDEVMVYLAASILSGDKLDVEEVAALARISYTQARDALLSLLNSGDLEVVDSCLRLGPLGGAQ